MLFHALSSLRDALHDHAAVLRSLDLSQLGADFAFTQSLLDLIQPLDEQQYDPRLLWICFFGFIKLAPHMRPAGGQADVAVALCGVALINLIAVAADDAAEVCWDDVAQALGSPPCAPHEQGVSSRSFQSPKVALLGLAVAGT